MFRTIRTNFDRREMRRDRRYPLPPMVVRFASGEYETVNWSLSGFLLAGGPAVEIGAQVSATIRVTTSDELFSVTAEAVRHDADIDGVAFRFVEPSEDFVSVLDRVIAVRMFGRPVK
jgi:hypothetical protein